MLANVGYGSAKCWRVSKGFTISSRGGIKHQACLDKTAGGETNRLILSFARNRRGTFVHCIR